MRAARLGFLGSLCLASACGFSSPPAVAEPRRSDDGAPLIQEPLADDVAVARALRQHYTKFEYRIPMRDGKKLFTAVYVPKDASRTYPIMLQRTPYSVAPYGVDNFPNGKDGRISRLLPSPGFVRDGFIFADQDVRGALMSEGTFVDVRPHASKKGDIDESTDAWDTIDWLVKNVPSNNGRVGS